MSISIYLVEDDVEFSRILLQALNANPLFVVMGFASTIETARNFVFHNEPDVFIVDLSLPDGSGIELIEYIQSKRKASKILAMSSIGDEKHILGSLNAGACGFLLKSESPDSFERSVISLATHGSYLSPHASRLVIHEMKSNANHAFTLPMLSNTHYLPPTQTRTSVTLTPKEHQVVPLLAAGLPTKLIANELNVSPFTINQHLRSIYKKLKVRNKMEAVGKARELGLL
jgi:DNA-binding NarL/FixJ family response regulator